MNPCPLATIWVALGCVIGILFIWMVMAGRLREETEKTAAMTVSSLLARRFPGAEKPIALPATGPNTLSLTRGMTGTPAVILVLSGLSWALGYTGQPQLLTRMMAIRNEKEVRRAVGVATVWTLLAYTGAILIGLFGVAFVKSGLLSRRLVSAPG